MSSPQPPRVRVAEAITRLLDEAPSSEKSGLPQGFTHWELACSIYGVTEPTAAHLSAVRRSVARLVAQGRAERSNGRWYRWEHRTGHHVRQTAHGDYLYANPIGVLVSRTMTDADREARAQVLSA